MDVRNGMGYKAEGGGWLRCPQEVGKRGVHQDLLSPLGLGLSVR